MRRFLLIFGWVSLVGSILESAVLLHAGWLIAFGPDEWTMTVLSHIRDHLSIFYWLIELSYAVFPDDIVRYFLNLPSLVFYPVRITASILLGGWALSAARRMKQKKSNNL